MSKKIIVLLILVSAGILMADLSEQAIRDIFADQLLNAEDIYQQLQLFNDFENVGDKGKVINEQLEDGSPWFYYVPTDYDPHQGHSLIIWLHGGVGREDYFEPDEYIYEHPILELAENADMLVLFPMAHTGCEWWNPAGEEHILSELLIMKERFNIDDDRVFMTGFSDGGSGSFHFSYCLPDEFASFYPLNGMVSVAAYETKQPCFLRNMMNRHLRAVNTDEDDLYPASATRLTMSLALDAGADLSYREYWGFGHDWGYFEDDIPLILKDMQKRERDSFHSEIYWECVSAEEYNRCDWLEITELDTLEEKQDWQQEYNVQLPDNRISFGFYHDREFKGDGIMVNSVIDSTLAVKMGLREGDIIIAMDDVTITNIDEMENLKAGKKRGEEVSLTVYREGETYHLTGEFPETTYYSALFYNQPSGAVKGKYYGNIFELETSRIGALALYINPEMLNLEIPVNVIINGEEVFNEKVDYDQDFMKDWVVKHKDRKVIWVNRLEFEVQ